MARKRYRFFNGKKYNLIIEGAHTKRNAREWADTQRKGGYSVRIIKCKTKTSKTRYDVWTRYGGKRRKKRRR